MEDVSMNDKNPTKQRSSFSLNEDWLSVLLAFLLILLAVIGILGEHGIKISF
jgi:hypothetical protein